MTFWCKFRMRVLTLFFGIFRLFNFSMECSCKAPVTHGVMVMSGLVFHPFICIALMSMSYLVCFCVMACSGNLSWQYVNSMSCTVIVGDGVMGVGVWLGAPMMHTRMSGLSLARHWHGVCGHVHLRNLDHKVKFQHEWTR